MNLNDEQVESFMHQLREGQEINSPVNESSWEKNDKAFIDRDIEDATKQFYEDGK